MTPRAGLRTWRTSRRSRRWRGRKRRNDEPGIAKKPFAFRLSHEALKEFKDAPAEAKLNWLEEARQFVVDFVSPQKLEKWKKISGQ